ncbi:MAG: hypothetical protein K0S43_724 [Cellulosimicrobium sp.]|jgi:hypothetical protein|nr:hypothetical protein [Cellulosimicrobium sp.]
MPLPDPALDRLPVGRAGESTGHYRLDLRTCRWWWSEQTYRIHGFEPGDVVPTTALILAHKHPEDREQVRALFDDAVTTGSEFLSTHRITDARGAERHVVLTGRALRDSPGGELTELGGLFVDITPTVTYRAREYARRDIETAAQGRGPIEQAKGVLVAAFGVGPDVALARLKRTSSLKNLRVRDLALVVVDEASRGGEACRERLDSLLG